MNTAEIVIREVQGNSGLQIVQLPRKSVGKPGQSPKLHSHGQVLPFNETGGNVFRVGNTAANFGYNLRDSWWGVPLTPVLTVVAKQFGQLREVSISREGFLDCLSVKDVGIRGQLNTVIPDARRDSMVSRAV
jgi:hypothetical protein